MQCVCPILSSMAWPDPRYCPHYLINCTIFWGKNVFNIKCVFWFSLKLSSLRSQRATTYDCVPSHILKAGWKQRKSPQRTAYFLNLQNNKRWKNSKSQVIVKCMLNHGKTNFDNCAPAKKSGTALANERLATTIKPNSKSNFTVGVVVGSRRQWNNTYWQNSGSGISIRLLNYHALSGNVCSQN
jgi:hypothetical protein